MDKSEEIKALESQRKREWRKFLFKDAMFLNCVIYLCLIGAFYSSLKVVVPMWFIGPDDIYISHGLSEEDAFFSAENRIRGQGIMFMVITLMFAFAMCMIKLAFYHEKFVVYFNKVEYYKAFQSFNDKYFLNQYFIYSNQNFPIETIRDSEIVSHDKEIVMAKEKRWDMYLSSGYFSGYINGCASLMGHVMCKDTFKDKGKTQAVIVYNSLTISVLLQTDFKNDFRLKLEHDRTNKWFGQLLQSSKLGPDKLIKLNDKKFEGLFKIYSNNPKDAEEFLTQERKQKLQKWKMQLDKKMKVTLINNRLTISLPIQRKLLYPKIYSKMTLESFDKQCAILQSIFEDLECFNEKNERVQGHAV